MQNALQSLLQEGVQTGVFPAGQACVGTMEKLHFAVAGSTPDSAPIDEHTIFDIASITKLLSTTLLTAQFIASGKLGLDDPVAQHVPTFVGDGREQITIRDLLAHRSGLPAWRPWFANACSHPQAKCIFQRDGRRQAEHFRVSREIVMSAVVSEPLVRPPGTRVYSDAGFILLGHVLEGILGGPLSVGFASNIAAPLGLVRTGFVDLAASETLDAIPTGRTRPREPAPGQEGLFEIPDPTERDDPGEVDDDNAYALGGVAGHAGLFSTAEEVATAGLSVLRAMHDDDPLGIGSVVPDFLKVCPAEGPARGLGFDIASGSDSTAGAYFGSRGTGAVGHIGFSGCSLWIDLERRAVAVLLSNRVYPTRANIGIKAFRPRFHDEVTQLLDA